VGQEPEGEKARGCLRGVLRNREESFFLQLRKILRKYLHERKWTVSYCVDTGGGSPTEAFI